MHCTQVSEEDNPKLLPVTDFLNKIEKWDEEHEFGPESELPNVSNFLLCRLTVHIYHWPCLLSFNVLSDIIFELTHHNSLESIHIYFNFQFDLFPSLMVS